MRRKALDGALVALVALVASSSLLACGGSETEHHGEHDVQTSPGLPPRLSEATPADAAGPPAYEGPKLVVVMVVEQTPADLVTRIEPELRGGMATLLREGLVFRNAFSGHGLPQAVAGHATLVTGRYPAEHGLMGPEQLANGEVVETVVDGSQPLVGAGSERQGLAPSRLLVDSIGDRLRAARPDSKVFALGLDGPNTVALGGRKPSGAYWYDTLTGDFVSSEHYIKQLPVWLTTFNANDRPQALMKQSWELLREPSFYEGRARADEASFEFDGEHTTFPHALLDGQAPTREIVYRPAADRVVLEAAQRLIASESLGTDGEPDLLLVSLGAGSHIVQRYGANSVEAADYVAQLDRLMGRFVGAVDKSVGANQWMLVLTADRGASPMPEGWLDGQVGERIEVDRLLADLERASQDVVKEAGASKPEFRFEAGGITVDYGPDVAAEQAARVNTAIAEALREDIDYIADAFSRAELADARLSGRMYLSEMRRSFRSERSPDLMLRLEERACIVDGAGAVVSSSPYRDDSAIPLVIRMPGIEARELERPIFLVDIVPTLERLFGLTPSEEETPGATIIEVFGEDP